MSAGGGGFALWPFDEWYGNEYDCCEDAEESLGPDDEPKSRSKGFVITLENGTRIYLDGTRRIVAIYYKKKMNVYQT